MGSTAAAAATAVIVMKCCFVIILSHLCRVCLFLYGSESEEAEGGGDLLVDFLHESKFGIHRDASIKPHIFIGKEFG